MGKTILVMAGGTGGHIFPGIAVAKFLAEKGWNIHWLGTADRMEANIVPDHGIDISFIDIGGLRGKGIKSLITLPFKLIKAVWQAKQVIAKVKPDVVLGLGGYASGPGGIAARLSGVPLVLHEQNAVAGMTNKYLAKIATKVLAAFPNAFTALSAKNYQVTGNPLRQEIIDLLTDNKDLTSAEESAVKVLVVGGSLGAKVLNETVPNALFSIKNRHFEVWHQCGQNNSQNVENFYHELGLTNDRIRVTDFIENMAAAYQWADVVICRAGALTVSELAIAGTPAIFVPLPQAVDDHQTQNALYLVNRGAGQLLPQKELTGSTLSEHLTALFADKEKLASMAEAARLAAKPEATELVANVCEECAL